MFAPGVVYPTLSETDQLSLFFHLVGIYLEIFSWTRLLLDANQASVWHAKRTFGQTLTKSLESNFQRQESLNESRTSAPISTVGSTTHASELVLPREAKRCPLQSLPLPHQIQPWTAMKPLLLETLIIQTWSPWQWPCLYRCSERQWSSYEKTNAHPAISYVFCLE